MDDIRKRILDITKKELSQKPFVNGKRYTIICTRSKLGSNESEIENAFEKLDKDLKGIGLKLSHFPGTPNILCAEETEET